MADRCPTCGAPANLEPEHDPLGVLCYVPRYAPDVEIRRRVEALTDEQTNNLCNLWDETWCLEHEWRAALLRALGVSDG